jgi:MMP 1-O-methyltransferase
VQQSVIKQSEERKLSLSVGILAFNSAEYIEPLLRAVRDFADEIVVGVDSSSTDSTEQICRDYADKLFRLEPIGSSERALAWLNEQCTGDWIFRLDDDELPSIGLIEALPRLMSDRQYTHYWLLRRWIIGHGRSRWIAQHPWWPDWQLRLFRNIWSIVGFPGHLHSEYTVQGAGGCLSPGSAYPNGSIYHLTLVYQSEERRREKLRLYEQISPYNSLPHYYFPRTEEVATRPIPDDDRPWSGAYQSPGRQDEAGVGSARKLTRVSLEEMRQSERRRSEYPSDLYLATLDCLSCPEIVQPGKTFSTELRLRNDSRYIWRSPGLGMPEIHLAYHLIDKSGELCEYEGLRTILPLTLRPGESIKLIALVVPPWEPGHYIIKWDPVIEHVSWFSVQGWTGPQTAIEVRFGPDTSPEMEQLAKYLQISHRIPGWFRGEEAVALAHASYSLPDKAVIVEIGAFLGSGSVLLAGPRKLKGSGKVYCVDLFDGSGDSFSTPLYQATLARLGGESLRGHFETNIRVADLCEWVEVRQGIASDIAKNWTTPVDLLVLDGDHSRQGARDAYESWSPFLKPEGIIAIHNSNDRVYSHDHDGNRRLVVEEIFPPRYTDIHLVATTTFARNSKTEFNPRSTAVSCGGATPRRRSSPRAVTRHDVQMAYRLILGREPESEEAIAFHLQWPSLAELRSAFLSSDEFLRGLPQIDVDLACATAVDRSAS